MENNIDHMNNSDTDYYNSVNNNNDANVEKPAEEDLVLIPESENYDFSWRKLWLFAGPGVLASIAYLDPGNLESDLQSGATAGYTLIWVLFWSTVVGAVMQIMAARLGVITGKNMAEVCRDEMPQSTIYVLWSMAEVAIIASDIQEVIGSAYAMKILFGLDLWIGVLITGADTFTFLFLHVYGVRTFEFLFGFLVSIMAVAMAVCFGISKPDAAQIGVGLVRPYVTKDTVLQAVATLGAVVMPHALYLHSALVQSRNIDRRNKKAVAEANMYNAIETSGSLFVSFIINMFVMAVFAKGFYGTEGADKIGLQEAGDKLGETYGQVARIIWGIGLLASGQSATMTGTLAGQYVMQGFIELKVVPWKRVLITRSIAIVPALLVAILSIGNLDFLDECLNALQSVQLPFAILPLILFSSSPIIMGEFVAGKFLRTLVWTIFFVLLGINVYLVINLAGALLPNSAWVFVILGFVGLLYFGFMAFVAIFFTRKQAELELKRQGDALHVNLLSSNL